MNGFVLDASVSMRWVLETSAKRDQQYAWRVLDQLGEVEAIVPSLWHLEVSNVLLSAERDRLIGALDAERFIEQLESLPIRTDTLTAAQALTRTLAIARSCKLTSYDAAYLELSIRTGSPLASLDRDLRKGAATLDIPLYQGIQ